VNDGIGAQVQRILEVRRSKGTVYDHRHVLLGVSDFSDGGDVRDLERGIGRRLDINDLGVGTHGLLDGFRICRIDDGILYAIVR
jgi:hypothetical protein